MTRGTTLQSVEGILQIPMLILVLVAIGAVAYGLYMAYKCFADTCTCLGIGCPPSGRGEPCAVFSDCAIIDGKAMACCKDVNGNVCDGCSGLIDLKDKTGVCTDNVVTCAGVPFCAGDPIVKDENALQNLMCDSEFCSLHEGQSGPAVSGFDPASCNRKGICTISSDKSPRANLDAFANIAGCFVGGLGFCDCVTLGNKKDVDGHNFDYSCSDAHDTLVLNDNNEYVGGCVPCKNDEHCQNFAQKGKLLKVDDTGGYVDNALPENKRDKAPFIPEEEGKNPWSCVIRTGEDYGVCTNYDPAKQWPGLYCPTSDNAISGLQQSECSKCSDYAETSFVEADTPDGEKVLRGSLIWPWIIGDDAKELGFDKNSYQWISTPKVNVDTGEMDANPSCVVSEITNQDECEKRNFKWMKYGRYVHTSASGTILQKFCVNAPKGKKEDGFCDYGNPICVDSDGNNVACTYDCTGDKSPQGLECGPNECTEQKLDPTHSDCPCAGPSNHCGGGTPTDTCEKFNNGVVYCGGSNDCSPNFPISNPTWHVPELNSRVGIDGGGCVLVDEEIEDQQYLFSDNNMELINLSNSRDAEGYTRHTFPCPFNYCFVTGHDNVKQCCDKAVCLHQFGPVNEQPSKLVYVRKTEDEWDGQGYCNKTCTTDDDCHEESDTSGRVGCYNEKCTCKGCGACSSRFDIQKLGYVTDCSSFTKTEDGYKRQRGGQNCGRGEDVHLCVPHDDNKDYGECVPFNEAASKVQEGSNFSYCQFGDTDDNLICSLTRDNKCGGFGWEPAGTVGPFVHATNTNNPKYQGDIGPSDTAIACDFLDILKNEDNCYDGIDGFKSNYGQLMIPNEEVAGIHVDSLDRCTSFQYGEENQTANSQTLIDQLSQICYGDKGNDTRYLCS